MARLLVHVEGQTEELFVNELLFPHLRRFGYDAVSARLIGDARQRGHRGGIIHGWTSVRKGILNHLKEDPRCFVTIMIDYYGMPQEEPKAWPGRAAAAHRAFPDKAPTVEAALLADVVAEMGAQFNPNRFLPFVIMHEFEALLFSDCERFAAGVEQPALAARFTAIRTQFNTPEEINDSPITAPSKRVEALIPGYQKPIYGGLAALSVGLDAMRAECPHFCDWLTKLESWPAMQQG